MAATNAFSCALMACPAASIFARGAVAFETALSFPNKLAGLLALSTYFATKDSIQFNPANQDLAIAIHHGTDDSVVPFSLSEVSSELLLSKGYSVEFKSYPMDHSVCREQIEDISQWFVNTLNLAS